MNLPGTFPIIIRAVAAATAPMRAARLTVPPVPEAVRQAARSVARIPVIRVPDSVVRAAEAMARMIPPGAKP